LTVISPEGPDGIELLLESNVNPVARAYQTAIYESGISATAFTVTDIQLEYERLKNLGVKFTMEPTKIENTILAAFDDTCCNLIQLFQI